MDELEAQLEIGKYDVVGITETWLQEGHCWELNIQGYSSCRKDREVGTGGGIVLLVRNEIQSLARGGIETGDVESVWLELRNCKGKKTLMGLIYWPLNSSLDIGRNLNQELKLACRKGNATVVMGDFNVQVDWENQVGNGPQEREFVTVRRVSTRNATHSFSPEVLPDPLSYSSILCLPSI